MEDVPLLPISSRALKNGGGKLRLILYVGSDDRLTIRSSAHLILLNLAYSVSSIRFISA